MNVPIENIDEYPLSREAWHDFVTQRQRTENALLERIKELDCLYGITRLAQNAEQPLDELLTGIAGLIPRLLATPRHRLRLHQPRRHPPQLAKFPHHSVVPVQPHRQPRRNLRRSRSLLPGKTSGQRRRPLPA